MPGFEFLGECVVGILEFGSVWNEGEALLRCWVKSTQVGRGGRHGLSNWIGEKRRTIDHFFDFSGRELTNRVGDGDVGASSGCLLRSGDFEDTVDINLENNLQDGITSFHRGNGSKSEFTKGGVIFTIDTLALEHRKLNGLLGIANGCKSPVDDVNSC